MTFRQYVTYMHVLCYANCSTFKFTFINSFGTGDKTNISFAEKPKAALSDTDRFEFLFYWNIDIDWYMYGCDRTILKFCFFFDFCFLFFFFFFFLCRSFPEFMQPSVTMTSRSMWLKWIGRYILYLECGKHGWLHVDIWCWNMTS